MRRQRNLQASQFAPLDAEEEGEIVSEEQAAKLLQIAQLAPEEGYQEIMRIINRSRVKSSREIQASIFSDDE